MVLVNRLFTSFVSLSLLAGLQPLQAQKENPFGTVTAFFEAFHQKDSTALQAFFDPKAQMSLTRENENGSPVKHHIAFDDFVRRVCQRPDQPQWEERLGTPSVTVHQNLATVWVPFSFYLDDQLSHTGFNLFQLYWDGLRWKILFLADTRTSNR
ncbi:MAG: hypothetical protein HN591_04825 [Flavobacteriales bacterium]|jgi:hypothetical protein|nr:hypothetical protein [Flavobacteriales bacterium]